MLRYISIVCLSHSIYIVYSLLWQLLDQCPIEAQQVNLTGEISSGNTSYVFIRELDREPQQYSTNYSKSVHTFVL